MSSSEPSAHNETLWSCAQCSQSFGQSKLLERHATSAQHRAYRCFCGRTFTRRTASVRHSKSHASHKSHQCSVCQKSFARRDHCVEHEERCIIRHQVSNVREQEKADDSSMMSDTAVMHSGISIHSTETELMPQTIDNPSGQAAQGSTFIVHAVWERPSNPVDDRMIEALRHNDFSRVRQALSEGANVNLHLDGTGPRPLHLAAAYSSNDIIGMLVECGADVNAQDNSGRSALHVATLKGLTETVICLLGLGARLSMVDEHGRTPLHLAAFRGHLGVARALRRAGADVDIEDNYGRAPYQLAAIYKHKTVAACLLAEGVTALQNILAAESAQSPEKQNYISLPSIFGYRPLG